MCHGDLKAENVLVTSWHWAYLADFASYKPVQLPADNPVGTASHQVSSGVQPQGCELLPGVVCVFRQMQSRQSVSLIVLVSASTYCVDSAIWEAATKDLEMRLNHILCWLCRTVRQSTAAHVLIIPLEHEGRHRT